MKYVILSYSKMLVLLALTEQINIYSNVEFRELRENSVFQKKIIVIAA